jgi:hypothetical protein
LAKPATRERPSTNDQRLFGPLFRARTAFPGFT